MLREEIEMVKELARMIARDEISIAINDLRAEVEVTQADIDKDYVEIDMDIDGLEPLDDEGGK